MRAKHLVVIVGPTAVGKTALTVQLAKLWRAPVLNADSRQVFKELAIGTAKPTPDEMEGVPHYFVNDRSITSPFSAGHFEQEGLLRLNELFKTYATVLVSGGSGLYIDALCYGFSEMPRVDIELRNTLKLRVESEGLGSLYSQLLQLDPDYAARIDPENQQRIVRALEVCLATGRPFSSFRTGAASQRNFKLHFIGLELPREELYQRINKRMDAMLAAGLFNEAKMNEKYKHLNALQTVGYSEIFGYLDGQYTKEEAIRLLKRNSRRYAKRQLTWFKKNKEIQWFSPNHLQAIMAYLKDRQVPENE